MKIMYKCEACGKMYNTKEAAMYCEKIHGSYAMVDLEFCDDEYVAPRTIYLNANGEILPYDIRNYYVPNKIKLINEKIKQEIDKIEMVNNNI